MRTWLVIVLVVLGIVFAVGGYFAYYVFVGPDYSSNSGNGLENPVGGLTDTEAVLQFDEDFVLYLLYSIEANKLHRPPLSDNRPKIEIRAGNVPFNAEVFKGAITVREGTIGNEDIVITTTKSEAVRMLRNPAYVVESFRSGKSTIILEASEVSLAAKGYLSLYQKLTGEKI